MANVVLLTKSTDTRNTVTSSNQIYAYQSPDSLDGIPSWIMTKEPNEMYVSGGGASLALPFGSAYSAGTLRIKEFLMRNGHPYSYIDLERDPDVQNLLDTFQISASEDVEASLHFVIPLTKKSQTTLASTNLLTKLKYVIWLED